VRGLRRGPTYWPRGPIEGPPNPAFLCREATTNQRLRERNPNADEVEGDICYHDLKSVPGGVDAVVIGTRPETAEGTMRECAELGIKQVWMHRAFGAGSVSDTATAYGRRHGVTVIDGGCPLMFEPASDPGHKVIRLVGTLTGKVPRRV